MIIKKITMKNFKSHMDTAVSFSGGINLMLGSNGAGKSSIFEAISFALFKESLVNIDNLVRKGSPELSVKLTFSSSGNTYTVFRKRKGNSSESKLFRNDTVIQSGDSAVTSEIEKIIGFDKRLFMNAVYVRQGETENLLTDKPAERKKTFTKLLGIDALQKSWDKMPSIISEYKIMKVKLDSDVSRIPEIAEKISSTEKELSEVMSSLKFMKEGIEKAENELAIRRERLKDLDSKEKKFYELSTELKAAKQQLGEKEGRRFSVEKELSDIEWKESRMKFLESSIKEMSFIEKIIPLISEKASLNEKLSSAKEKLEIHRKAMKQSDSRLQKALEECRKVVGSAPDIRAAVESMKSTKQAAVRQIEENISQLRSDVASMKERNREIGEIMNQITSSKGICPVCSSSMSSEKKKELMESYEKTLSKNDESIKRFGEELDILSSSLEKERHIMESISGLNISLIEQLKDDVDRLSRDVRKASEEITGIEAVIREKDSVISSLSGSLDVSEISSKQKELKLHETEYHQLLGSVSRKPALEEEVESLKSEILSIRQSIESAESGISELSYDPKVHDEMKNELAEKERSYILMKESFASLGKESSMKHERLSELKSEIALLEGKRKERERLQRFIELLSKIREIFGKDSLQKEIRIKSKPLIEKYTREYFSQFNLEYSDIRLDDEYGVTLYGPAGETTAEMISGGEKVAASIALRLGLTKALSGGIIETMILDEPTIHLDAQRRQELVAIFKRLISIPQMIVVTHDEGMEEAADSVHFVRKEKGISIVETANI